MLWWKRASMCFLSLPKTIKSLKSADGDVNVSVFDWCSLCVCVLCSATSPGRAAGVRTAPVHRRMHRHADLRKLPQPRAVHMLALLLLHLETVLVKGILGNTSVLSHTGKEGTRFVHLFMGCSCANRADLSMQLLRAL